LPPPECPVFEPSWEEFADPFAFINKIRPIAEKTGICKVRPPPDWQPPFACDVDKLHFTPRIQRLNELEAQTRVKLNFLDKIAKFWELQGYSLKIPHVERKILDLYQLNKNVADEGGFDIVCRDRRWTAIALKMGFAPGKAVGSHLRSHYERILYPYNLFQSGANLVSWMDSTTLMICLSFCLSFEQKPTLLADTSDKEYKPHDLAERQQFVQPAESCCNSARRAKRMRTEVDALVDQGLTHLSEELLSKPVIPIALACNHLLYSVLIKFLNNKVEGFETEKSKSRYKKKTGLDVDLYVCLVCGSGSDEDRLLLCDGCDDSYHTFCLIPPLNDIPKGDWRCPKCLAQECSKPPEAFGFEQAYSDYSLRAFGDMADSFKSDYFNMPVHMVPTELVEKEFWRLVSTIEEDVTVEYGADIASKEFGSGFPIRNGRFKVAEKDEKYLKCGWNLNNMAMMEPSVLTHVTADICGMTLPWLYVGMCFSSFCWHIEDHWSYSINYLHWGEPKTWYGAPGFAAEQLEAVMKKLTPELFKVQPDLLHQLVTIMNPNTLMSYGVPIYRTNQCAGEFVITFPRAYHSGFNQGFNFAEAVNFCTVDWMPLGRQCVEHYRLLHRYCVFSHDEMICKMASKADSLDVVLASAIQKDMKDMIREERELRDKVHKMGVLRCEQAEYDLLQDDERQCAKCRTTCYLSAITCPCRPGQLVCLHHIQDLCPCPVTNYTLNYRFTLDDLYPMMNAVKQRAGAYDEWASQVTETLDAKLDKKKSLSVLRSLIDESDAKMFPDNDLLRQLRVVTQDAEKCSSVAQQLLNGKKQTRFRCGGGRTQSQLTVQELRSFVRQLYNLHCSLPQAPKLKELLNRIEDFQQHSEKFLAAEIPGTAEIHRLLDVSFDFDVELPELPLLRQRLEQARWMEGVQEAKAHPSSLNLETMRRLIDQGVGLTPHPCVEKAMASLQELLTVSEHWEDKASRMLKARPPLSIQALSEAAENVAQIPAHLPNCLLLRDSISKAREWLQEAEALQVVKGGRNNTCRKDSIPVHLDPLKQLESLLSEVHAWKESAAKTFLMNNSHFSLLEVLCPRCEVGTGSPKRKSRKSKDASRHSKNMMKLHCVSDLEKALSESHESASALATLREVRLREMEALSYLRAANESKLLPTADCMDLKVCVCQKPPMGAMLQCELCRDAFHSVCVRAPLDARPAQAWLCPRCQRSAKPPLDAALGLLAELQRTRVRLPEGDALNYLVERTVNWQHRARQLSASYGLPDLEKSCATPPSPDGKLRTVLYFLLTTLTSCAVSGLSVELEELMVEGLLLQVSLPEVTRLYHVLLNGLRRHHTSRQTSPQDDPTLDREKQTLKQSEKKAKRRLERGALEAEHRDKAKKLQNKRQKMNMEKNLERRAASTSSSPRSDVSHSDDSEEEMAVCPAEGCQQPEGDEVDWVQCDGSCNQWFHQVCVGVTAELAEKEDYVCVSCTVRKGC
uniref:[histone H3]-trimethyl-L-lysine(4) demethylase n=1 Tax=Esox lucius TaxID=8010 RepID=A0A6Q2X4A9_ESOLU